ncbi:MAG: antibiotic biosynthesis monooxygenase [Deltaproteobacteria bacterium]|nr:MAG: antibiotic biosynthesis monooxygenase [Deltaproteobacteria bacterium]
MTVKILIKRTVKKDKIKEVVPFFRELRNLAASQSGYISGETLRNADAPDNFLVISTWQSSDDWKQWVQTSGRNEIQDKIDSLIGGKTEYEIFHYGFKE